jgi:hypothetical protein
LSFQRPFEKLSPLFFPGSAVLDVVCSFLSLSLSARLSSLLPELARARTRQSCDANARFSRVFLCNEALNAVLLLSELSGRHYVTLESSKTVKLALTWVATTQSDAIK